MTLDWNYASDLLKCKYEFINRDEFYHILRNSSYAPLNNVLKDFKDSEFHKNEIKDAIAETKRQLEFLQNLYDKIWFYFFLFLKVSDTCLTFFFYFKTSLSFISWKTLYNGSFINTYRDMLISCHEILIINSILIQSLQRMGWWIRNKKKKENMMNRRRIVNLWRDWDKSFQITSSLANLYAKIIPK